MQAQLIRRHGEPDVFELGTLPKPSAGPGQVLVRQVATSVNPADAKIRRKGPALGPELPAVLGMDVAGVIEALGPGVDGFAVGDAVYGCAAGVRGMPGALAEYVATDARLLAPAPRTLPLREAAALPLVTITAWEGLIERARVGAGDRVLVLGGTGGVGHVAIQLAHARRAIVDATASGAGKAALARALGARATIDYRAEALEEAASRLTGGRGYDIVFDATGGQDLGPAFAAARRNGQVIAIVSTFGADLTPMHLKGLTLHVVFMLIPMLHDEGRERHGAILRQATALVDAGALRPLLDPTRYALADVAAAHRRLERGEAVGKLVIKIGPP
jgi:NADPH2:quinone reductase